MEPGLVARWAVDVRVPVLGVTARSAAGERLRTEVSAKSHRQGVERGLGAAGTAVRRWWADGDVALSLSVRAGAPTG